MEEDTQVSLDRIIMTSAWVEGTGRDLMDLSISAIEERIERLSG